MRLNLNTSGAHAARQLNATVKHLEDSVGRLSSGDRIASATDDAAGLVISNRLRAQVSGLRQAMRNAQDGLSITQIQDDAFGQMNDILLRIRDLAVRAANTAISDVGIRTGLKNEADQLVGEGRRVIERTTFGSMRLFPGMIGTQVELQVGSDATSNDRIAVPLMGVGFILQPGITTEFVTEPDYSILLMDVQLDDLQQRRSQVGALTKRFESVVASLQTTSDNVAVGESRIRDVDMAAEMVGYTKHQVMRDASSAMLAQASRIHENLLGLLAA